MKTYQKGDIVNFMADRGGVDKKYTVTVRQAHQDGNHVSMSVVYNKRMYRLSLTGEAVNSMDTLMGCNVRTVCKHGWILNT